MRAPNCRPITVTTGSRALRSACLTSTVRRGAPLARAVRTKSWFSTSSIADRDWRATSASEKRARVIEGSTKPKGF